MLSRYQTDYNYILDASNVTTYHTRAGYEGTAAPTQAVDFLEMAAKARTAEAKGEPVAMLPFTPSKENLDENNDKALYRRVVR